MGVRSILIALVLAAVAGQARADGCVLEKLAEFPVTMSGLRPLIPLKVAGQDALFLADTGAFFSMVTPDAAAKFGLKIHPTPMDFYVKGVSGDAEVSIVTAPTVEFDGIPIKNVDFLVTPQASDGAEAGLIGQNLLRAADVEYDLANGVIRFFNPKGCERANMAYWAGSGAYSEMTIQATDALSPHIQGRAYVNGADIHVTFDTGAPTSVVSKAAADRAHVWVTVDGATDTDATRGFGHDKAARTWIVPVASFKVGDEEIKNTRLRVADTSLPGEDMLVGADFFLSHRVYISTRRHKLFFTYNGGPVFNLDATSTSGPMNTPAPAATVSDPFSNAPTNADGFARRAAAFLARKDPGRALADVTHAMELDPKEPRYALLRAQIEHQNGQDDLALADFGQALKIKPDDYTALLARADFHLARKERDLAKADLDAAAKLIASDAAERYHLAGLFDAGGFYAEAVEQYGSWIDAHAKSESLSEVLNGRCWVRAKWGHDLDKALDDCNAALKLSPGAPDILDSRGLVYLRQDAFDLSIADYDAALRKSPKEPWSLYGRGLAEAGKGQKTESDADLKAAVAADPEIAAKAKAIGLAP